MVYAMVYPIDANGLFIEGIRTVPFLVVLSKRKREIEIPDSPYVEGFCFGC